MEKKKLYSFISINLYQKIFEFIPDAYFFKFELSLYSKKLQKKFNLTLYDFQKLFIKKNLNNIENINFSFDLLYNQISSKFNNKNKSILDKFYYKFISENLIINLHTINYFNVIKSIERIKEMINFDNPLENIEIILKNESYKVLKDLNIDYNKIKKFKLYQKNKENNFELFNWNIFEKLFTSFSYLSTNLIQLELFNIEMDNLESINNLINLKHLYLNNIKKSSIRKNLILKLEKLEEIKLFNIEIEIEKELFNSLQKIIFFNVEFYCSQKINLSKVKNIIIMNCISKSSSSFILPEIDFFLNRNSMINIDYKLLSNNLSKIQIYNLDIFNKNNKFYKIEKCVFIDETRFLNTIKNTISIILNSCPNINEIYINSIYLNLKEIDNFKKNRNFNYQFNICTIEIKEEQIIEKKLNNFNELIGKKVEKNKNKIINEKFFDFNLMNINNFSSENQIEYPGIYHIQISFFKDKIIPFENIFKGGLNITSINLNTKGLIKKIKSMDYMFQGCDSLKSVILNNFDSTKVTSMKGLFYNCKNLYEVDLSNIDTSKVISMNSMFYYCKSLESLNLSNFNTKKVIDMSHMFDNCSLIKFIDISSFNTKNVVNMSSMFYNCCSLEEIDLSHFNIKKVNDMSHMFSYCSLLTTIDLSGFIINKSIKINGIFDAVNEQCDIIADDVKIKKLKLNN